MPEEGGASTGGPPKRPKMGVPAVPLDLEALSPVEAAAVLKRHNPRIAGRTEMLAETIRRVRSGEIEPLEEDVFTMARRILVESEKGGGEAR